MPKKRTSFLNPTRILTNADIQKYVPLVEKVIREYVKLDCFGKMQGIIKSTGWDEEDFRQHMMMELCIALKNYKGDYITSGGSSVKEITFVYGHLYKKISQQIRQLSKEKRGYSKNFNNPEEIFFERKIEE